MDKWPLGVFTSINAGLGVPIEHVYDLGVPTIHLRSPLKTMRTQARAEQLLAVLEKAGIHITLVFCGFEDDNLANIPTATRTVGLAPPTTRAARLAEFKDVSDYARLLGVEAVGGYIGFIPLDAADPLRREMVAVARELCDYCKANDQNLHLETGQIPVDSLLALLHEVDRENLFVNFDSGNIILYGNDEPIQSLRKLGRYVRSVHCKDAKWAVRPGEDWGVEMPLGEGDVGIENFLRTLDDVGYTGPLTLECEIQHRQKEKFVHGIRLLNELKTKIG